MTNDDPRATKPTPPRLIPDSELVETAGGFIHDIKNHLGTLSLNLQLLAEDFESPQTPRERKALERITRLHGECQKLVELSNDFLRFTRAEELNCQTIALGEVVGRMIDFLAPTARQQGIEIHWFPSAELPPVNLDRDRFEHALLNLMLNAEQAMPEGGSLTLIGRAEHHHTAAIDPLATHTHTHTPRWVCLDVIDTGCGMSQELLGKVFRAYHTTKKDGNGLGLPTARKVVVAHGGTLEVQSEPGHGTKFTIRLPAAGGE